MDMERMEEVFKHFALQRVNSLLLGLGDQEINRLCKGMEVDHIRFEERDRIADMMIENLWEDWQGTDISGSDSIDSALNWSGQLALDDYMNNKQIN